MKFNLKLPKIRLPAVDLRLLIVRFKAKIRAVKAKITPENVKETCLLVGFFMLLRGLWLIWPPIMWIIGGILLMWFGLPGKKGDK
jgi:hypothetical protein